MITRISFASNNAQHQIGTEQTAELATFLRASDEYLGHLIAMGKIDKGLGGIITLQERYGIHLHAQPGEVSFTHTSIDPNRTTQFLIAVLAGLQMPFVCSLDVYMHQLPAADALREKLGGEIQRRGAGCDRRAYA